MVKRRRSQSAEEPILWSWFTIRSSYSSFHFQASFKKPSLPSSHLSMPISFSLLITFTSVAMAAWSVPGCHKASKPCILLKRIRVSCKALSKACPMCSCPVTLGGGIIMVKGFLLGFTFAAKAFPFSHFS